MTLDKRGLSVRDEGWYIVWLSRRRAGRNGRIAGWRGSCRWWWLAVAMVDVDDGVGAGGGRDVDEGNG